jgi:hypothetical protein
MEYKLNITTLFRDEQELLDTVKKRKICYDSEPYYRTTKGNLLQIGYQLNIYGTFPDGILNANPDHPEFSRVLNDVRRVAEALSNTCDPLHMCEAIIVDSNDVTRAPERGMRPDVTIHIPVFDQQNYGLEVDENVKKTLDLAGRILENSGVRKIRWD